MPFWAFLRHLVFVSKQPRGGGATDPGGTMGEVGGDGDGGGFGCGGTVELQYA